MAFQGIGSAPKYMCLSTDVKPVTVVAIRALGIEAGATAVETDTGNMFMFDGAAWVASPAINATLTGSITGEVVSASQTRPNDVTAYAALDVVGQNPAANMTFANVLPNAGGTFVVLGARLRIDVAAIPAGMSSFRLHLYNAAPTAIADNAAYNLPVADRAKYLGYVEISNVQDIGDTLWSQATGLNFMGKLAVASTSLYGILQTVGAFTPTASVVKTVTLNIVAV